MIYPEFCRMVFRQSSTAFRGGVYRAILIICRKLWCDGELERIITSDMAVTAITSKDYLKSFIVFSTNKDNNINKLKMQTMIILLGDSLDRDLGWWRWWWWWWWWWKWWWWWWSFSATEDSTVTRDPLNSSCCTLTYPTRQLFKAMRYIYTFLLFIF